MAFKHAYDILSLLVSQASWSILGTLILARKSPGADHASRYFEHIFVMTTFLYIGKTLVFYPGSSKNMNQSLSQKITTVP